MSAIETNSSKPTASNYSIIKDSAAFSSSSQDTIRTIDTDHRYRGMEAVESNRTPPVEIAAEQQVLGSMLQLDGGIEAIDTVRTTLTPADFYNGSHRQIYRIILELRDAGTPVDDLLAQPYRELYLDTPEIADVPTPLYIETLRNSTPTAVNTEYFADKVKEASRLREIIRMLYSVGAKAYNMDLTSAELVGEIQNAISKNQIIGSVIGKVPSAKDDWPGVFSQLCQNQRSEFLGLQTGFRMLDKATLGLRGLSVLGGVPGQGKSSLALQLSTQIASINGIPVLYYALEMSKLDIYIKIISRLSGLDYSTLTIGSEINGRRGQGLTEDHTQRLSVATVEFMEYADRVKIIDRTVCKEISLPVVKLHIQQAKREFDADQVFVVIDHLQIFPCDNSGRDDMKSRLDYLVAEFKAISEQMNAAILLISEKNRNSYDKEWLGAFMGSAGIEYGADLAMLLHEESEAYGSPSGNNGDVDNRCLDLVLAKNRFGKRAEIAMRFHPDISEFSEK